MAINPTQGPICSQSASAKATPITLGLKKQRGKYTPWEGVKKNLLKELYTKELGASIDGRVKTAQWEAIAEKVEHSVQSCKCMVIELRSKEQEARPHNKWTDGEKNLLKELYTEALGASTDGIVKLAQWRAIAKQVKHSPNLCKAILVELGLKEQEARQYNKWTDEQKNLLRKLYTEALGASTDGRVKTAQWEAIAEKVGHSVNNCEAILVKLGLKKQEARQCNKWTDEQKRLLKELYTEALKTSVDARVKAAQWKAIAEKVEHPVNSCKAMIAKLEFPREVSDESENVQSPSEYEGEEDLEPLSNDLDCRPFAHPLSPVSQTSSFLEGLGDDPPLHALFDFE